MNEQNERTKTRREIHQRLSTQTDPQVKEYRRKIRNTMWVVCIAIAITVGGAIAIWDNVGLGMLLGGVSFSTLGALVLALGAMPKENTILDMGGTYYNGNIYLVTELRKNRVLTQWGIFSILIGYLFLSANMALRVLG